MGLKLPPISSISAIQKASRVTTWGIRGRGRLKNLFNEAIWSATSMPKINFLLLVFYARRRKWSWMPPFTNLAVFFLTLFKTPLTPRLPSFEHLVDFFLTDWEALCTALRLDKIRHTSEEPI